MRIESLSIVDVVENCGAAKGEERLEYVLGGLKRDMRFEIGVVSYDRHGGQFYTKKS